MQTVGVPGHGDKHEKKMTRLAKALERRMKKDNAVEQFLGPNLTALHTDVAGRMTKALKGEQRFNRWGKHYLRALTRSHQLQLCTNFMDPGLQHRGLVAIAACLV